jgi:hypothetical protein
MPVDVGDWVEKLEIDVYEFLGWESKNWQTAGLQPLPSRCPLLPLVFSSTSFTGSSTGSSPGGTITNNRARIYSILKHVRDSVFAVSSLSPSTPMSLSVRSLPLCVRSLSLSSACRKAVSRQYHRLHHAQPRRLPRFGARLILVAGVATTTAVVASPLWPNDVYADTNDDANGEDANIRSVPLTSLLRSYFVFSVCSVPVFVDWSPHIISFMTSVPGLKQLAGALVRRSFFAQVRIFPLDHHFR